MRAQHRRVAIRAIHAPTAGVDQLDLGPLPSLTGYVLRRAQLVVFDDFIKTFAPLGLRPAQFSTLIVIRRNPGRKQSEIAAALGIKQANFVALMDELDQRGLTRRVRSSTDRRSHALTLTAKGDALLQKALGVLEKYEQRFVSQLGSDDHERLLELLRKIR
jgi:DNA-binding MarR family transcriptional regulator